MKTEDFVTYEQAVALKKLGFDWRLNQYYTDKGSLIYDAFADNFNVGSGSASAPTLSQAQKWLFEKGYFVEVNWFYTGTYYFSVVHLNNPKVTCVPNEDDYSTPTEALLAGITECLKLLEK